MSKWYLARYLFSNLREVDVHKEDEDSVYVASGRKYQKDAKDGGYWSYHKTEMEALLWLKQKHESAIQAIEISGCVPDECYKKILGEINEAIQNKRRAD